MKRAAGKRRSLDDCEEMRDGKDAQMRKMATDIIATQKKEMARLDAFLAKQGHSVDKVMK